MGLCSFACTTTAPPPPVARTTASGDGVEYHAQELLDTGKAPLLTLRYSLDYGVRHHFTVVQLMRVFEQGTQVGKLQLEAPLVVEVSARPGQAFALVLALGPVTAVREGDTGSIRWGREAKGVATGVMRANLELTSTGEVRQTATLREPDGADDARPLLDTLLQLDRPPYAAVGAGARWRTSRTGPDGETMVVDHELLEAKADRATFRVHRRQVAAGRELQSLGEWTFTAARWPPVGRETSSFSLPEPSAQRIAASFEVKAEPR